MWENGRSRRLRWTVVAVKKALAAIRRYSSGLVVCSDAKFASAYGLVTCAVSSACVALSRAFRLPGIQNCCGQIVLPDAASRCRPSTTPSYETSTERFLANFALNGEPPPLLAGVRGGSGSDRRSPSRRSYRRRAAIPSARRSVSRPRAPETDPKCRAHRRTGCPCRNVWPKSVLLVAVVVELKPCVFGVEVGGVQRVVVHPVASLDDRLLAQLVGGGDARHPHRLRSPRRAILTGVGREDRAAAHAEVDAGELRASAPARRRLPPDR